MPVTTPLDATGDCAICQEPMTEENGELWKINYCIHIFHRACLAEIPIHQPRAPCPLCREDLSPTDWDEITGYIGTTSQTLLRMRGDPGEPRGLIVGRSFIIERLPGRRLTSDDFARRNNQSHGEECSKGCGHRNDWECLLHQTRLAALHWHIPCWPPLQEMQEDAEHLFNILAEGTPREGSVPSPQKLVNAFVRYAINDVEGEIRVDHVDIEWGGSSRQSEVRRPESRDSNSQNLDSGVSDMQASTSAAGHPPSQYNGWNLGRGGSMPPLFQSQARRMQYQIPPHQAALSRLYPVEAPPSPSLGSHRVLSTSSTPPQRHSLRAPPSQSRARRMQYQNSFQQPALSRRPPVEAPLSPTPGSRTVPSMPPTPPSRRSLQAPLSSPTPGQAGHYHTTRRPRIRAALLRRFPVEVPPSQTPGSRIIFSTPSTPPSRRSLRAPLSSPTPGQAPQHYPTGRLIVRQTSPSRPCLQGGTPTPTLRRANGHIAAPPPFRLTTPFRQARYHRVADFERGNAGLLGSFERVRDSNHNLESIT